MDNNFDEFENIKTIRRREILPWWIKFFSWVFMVAAVITCLTPIQFLFGQVPLISLYGFHSDAFFPFSLLFLYFLFIMNGLVGYMLWFEKDKAIDFGKICVLIGIAACIGSFIFSMVDGNFTIRLEVIALIIFYRKLSSIEYRWG